MAVLSYFLFFSGEPEAPITNFPIDPTAGGLISDISASPSNSVVGMELLAMLAKLQSISLDTSFFTDEIFLSLEDKSRPIQPEPLGAAVGRQNPFYGFAGTDGLYVPTQPGVGGSN